MEGSEKILTIIGVIFIIFYISEKYNAEVEFVKSTVDNRKYLVKSMSDKKEAANLLARINERIQTLINHFETNYPDWEGTKMLTKNYSPDSVKEGAHQSKYSTYSVNKGKEIVYCLRSKNESEELTDINTLMYVTVHELAHLATKEVGHTETFWENFKFMLQEAVKIGVYKKVDYRKKPKRYCGMTLTSNILTS